MRRLPPSLLPGVLRPLLSLAVALSGITLSSAQVQIIPEAEKIPQGVLTAGATRLDSTGKPLGYVALTSPQPETLRGREFSVYVKPGGSTAPGEFSFQGGIQPATNPAVASALLDRISRLGQDRVELDRAILYLYRKAKYPNYLGSLRKPREEGDPPWPDDPPQPGEPPLAEQAALVVARAARDPEIARDLDLASLVSPGIALLSGRAWSGVLPATGQLVTLEIRLRESGVDGPVVGRVELIAGVPLRLPAPGAPVQVPDKTPAGHLAIGLRWASPVNLRRLSLLNPGFKLYRVNAATASSLGMTDTPPEADALASLAIQIPEEVIQVGQSLLMPAKLFSETDVSDFTTGPNGDAATTFVIDRNERCCGAPKKPPFADGAKFYYFAVACDILGQPGEVSRGGLGTACHRIVPLNPNGLEVEVDSIGASHPVRISWNPVVGNKTPATGYQILRGLGSSTPPDPRIITGNSINDGKVLEMRDPALLKPYATVGVTPGPDGRIGWTDTAPFIQPGETCWYSVRSITQGACGLLYSEPSAPVYASIRKLNAPVPPQLCYRGNDFPFAVVRHNRTRDVSMNYPKAESRVAMYCKRESPGVTHVKFEVKGDPGGTVWEQTVYFPADQNVGDVGATFISTAFPSGRKPFVSCTAYSDTGAASRPVTIPFEFPEAPQNSFTKNRYQELEFVAGAFSLGSLPDENSALRSEVVSTNSAVGTAKRGGARGISVAPVTFSSPPPSVAGEDSQPSVLVERATPGGWVTIGGARIGNGVVVVPSEYEGPIRATLLKVYPPAGCTAVHQKEGGNGRNSPVTLGLCLSANTEEYRLYRQIGQQPVQLVSQGPASPAEGMLALSDQALPAGSAQVQYFTQVVDANGNASPMTPLLGCPMTLISAPPVSVLNRIKPKGEAEMTVEWYCPAPGVERFQIFVETEKASNFQLVFQVPAALAGVLSNQNPLQAQAILPGGLTPVTLVGNTAHSLGANTSLVGNALNTRSFYTGRVGGGEMSIGIGPVFSVNVPVNSAGKYRVWVKSVGLTGGVSGPSNVQEFSWRNPAPEFEAPEPRVPWPARALPEALSGAAFTIAVQPVRIPIAGTLVDDWETIWPDNTGERYLRGIRIGATPLAGSKDYDFLTNPRRIRMTGIDRFQGVSDPNAFISELGGRPGDKVLPAVLYRRQVPNPAFPAPAGDVIQVSPLIEDIAHYNSGGKVIVDPFIGVLMHKEPASLVSFSFSILDTQPLIEGAAYQYFLARFHANGELKDVIDAGTTTVSP